MDRSRSRRGKYRGRRYRAQSAGGDWSAAGLAWLSAGLIPENQATAPGSGDGAVDLHPEGAAAVAAHRVPQPRYDLVRSALGAGPAPMALLDISDGLLADLGHLAAASGVAVHLRYGALDDPDLRRCAETLVADPRQWILTGGEDHVFAGVWPSGATPPPGWTIIGHVEAGHGVLVDGARWTGRGGWESFSGTDSANPGNSR